jgi:hypothetical protein
MGRWRYLPLLVPIVGLVELGAHFFFSRRAPTHDQWNEVRALLASWYEPGDVVVIAPHWAEPMARWSFGDALMPLRDVARPDATRYAKALEVSILGSRAPELADWKLLHETKHGRFTLRALANPAPPAITYDFVDHLDPNSADVRLEKGSAPTVCSFTASAPVEGGGLGGPPIFPAARFTCSGESSHVFVGVTIIDDENFLPRRCVWSHPPGNHAAMITRFRDVPLGTKLHGHAGLGWLIERDRAVPPFSIRVVVGGVEIGSVVHEPGEGWKSFELPLAGAAGSKADVEFYVSSPGAGTHVCFEADSR